MSSQTKLRRYASLFRTAGVRSSPIVSHFLKTSSRSFSGSSNSSPDFIHRLSNFWIPTGGIGQSKDSKDVSHELLIKAGYLRQAHSGIFHMLPLGNRVQEKLEAVIDKHMQKMGAAKVSLSTISSEELWKKSGRFVGHGGELFAFHDRKDSKFLLSPTHEEEITSIVANAVQSYKDLPLRLYQITRKYRDEARPRQGLLRGREFTMKDLYTFDQTVEQAHATYEDAQRAYKAFLDELKLPYLVAKADSGNMGGNLSHEYHFVSSKGEDNVIRCSSCGHTINDELSITSVPIPENLNITHENQVQNWFGVTKDRKSLIIAWFPKSTPQPTDGASTTNEINTNAIKSLIPDVDLGVENPLDLWHKSNPLSENHSRPTAQIIEISDERIPATVSKPYPASLLKPDGTYTSIQYQLRPYRNGKSIYLTRTLDNDPCQSCHEGKVEISRAIEIGHTFYLGTRYSVPLGATFKDPHDVARPVQMGCHGIGVSRLVGAIASVLADDKGLNWPAVIAPFQVVVVPGKGNEGAAEVLTGKMVDVDVDTVLDDRKKPMGWKLNDADLVGYPVIVVLGRGWKDGRVEVQCRRLGVKEEVQVEGLGERVKELLGQL